MRPFDAVIIGAGLGGLATAARLAQGGLTVCVVEAQHGVGGFATTFYRQPYRFDASLHMLDGVEPEGANRRIWEAFGLHNNVRVVRPSLMRSEYWPDRRVDIPHGLEAWGQALTAIFPAEQAGFERLVLLAEQVHSAFLQDRDARLDGQARPELDPVMGRMLNATASDVLNGLLTDREAIAIAGSLSCYLGLGPDEIGAIPFLTMVSSYQRGGGTYPVGGSQAVSDAIAAVVTEHGGEIRLGTSVKAIRCRRGVVLGVTLDTGELLDTQVVVSNASPLATYNLIEGDSVEHRFQRRLNAMELGTTVLKVWLGLSEIPDSSRNQPYEIFLRKSYGTRFIAGSLEDIGVVAPFRLDPSCCPKGHGVFSFTTGLNPGLEPDSPEQWEHLADAMVDHVDKVLMPGVKSCIAVRSVASPHTFHSFTGNPGGTIHGFRSTPSQSGPRRFGARGPVSGLLHVGAWTYAGSGFLPAMTSGLVVAQDILRGQA